MDLRRTTWNASIRLALVVSTAATVVAIVLFSFADVPQIAIVLPVIVVGFTASWVQSGRVQRRESNPIGLPVRHIGSRAA